MIFKLSNKRRKKGFTLIELVVVMCIIGILASVLIPQISGYVTEAKKLKVLDQSRSVVMAVESYNLRNTSQIAKSDKLINITKKAGIFKYFTMEDIDKLNGENTVEECYKIVNGAEFEIDDSEKLISIISDTENNSSS